MFHRRYRLRGATDLERLRRRGRRWQHPLTILLVRSNDLKQTRVAVSASRRVGRAVERNRAKRLLRAALRSRLALLEPGWDCLFLARQPLAAATLADTEAAVDMLLRRARILARSGEASSA